MSGSFAIKPSFQSMLKAIYDYRYMHSFHSHKSFHLTVKSMTLGRVLNGSFTHGLVLKCVFISTQVILGLWLYIMVLCLIANHLGN